MTDGTDLNCRICDARHAGERIEARELMFGTLAQFDYFQCQDCGTLQIATIPPDMASYYSGASYYSFNNVRRPSALKRMVKTILAGSIVGIPERFPLGNSRLDRLRRGVEPWIALVPGLSRSSSILDVGCGEGARLEALAATGFASLSGIDPFLPADKAGRTASGVVLRRGELDELDASFDLITMHHSLEHVVDPGAILRAARERLNQGGHLLVRIPVFQPGIWDEFGVNWVQLDAPRHLHLFTIAGFTQFAQDQRLSCVSSGCDSAGWSLAWSKAYDQGMTMQQPDGSPNVLPFSESEMQAFEERSRSLNRQGRGDQAYFVLAAAQ